MITEKDMQYVLTIANYGNLTKAANALFLSQPALSIQLKRLENFLGIQLFERKGRRMILTYAGEEFVKSAREITMKCFELEDRMIDIGKNVAVKLQIGYMVRQMEALFPSVMTEFSCIHSQLYMLLMDICLILKKSLSVETLICFLDITVLVIRDYHMKLFMRTVLLQSFQNLTRQF